MADVLLPVGGADANLACRRCAGRGNARWSELHLVIEEEERLTLQAVRQVIPDLGLGNRVAGPLTERAPVLTSCQGTYAAARAARQDRYRPGSASASFATTGAPVVADELSVVSPGSGEVERLSCFSDLFGFGDLDFVGFVFAGSAVAVSLCFFAFEVDRLFFRAPDVLPEPAEASLVRDVAGGVFPPLAGCVAVAHGSGVAPFGRFDSSFRADAVTPTTSPTVVAAPSAPSTIRRGMTRRADMSVELLCRRYWALLPQRHRT